MFGFRALAHIILTASLKSRPHYKTFISAMVVNYQCNMYKFLINKAAHELQIGYLFVFFVLSILYLYIRTVYAAFVLNLKNKNLGLIHRLYINSSMSPLW